MYQYRLERGFIRPRQVAHELMQLNSKKQIKNELLKIKNPWRNWLLIYIKQRRNYND